VILDQKSPFNEREMASLKIDTEQLEASEMKETDDRLLGGNKSVI
jgi:hypothetical protein